MQSWKIGYNSYEEYTQSEHRQEVRKKFFRSKLWKGKCECYGKRKPVQLHHKTYKRLGREYLRDLSALCYDCHEAVHNLMIERSKLSLWDAAKKYKKILRKKLR